MEDFQVVGEALGKAITEGNIEEAMKLIQQAVMMDAEFEVYLENKDDAGEMPKPAEKVDDKANEIYETLIEMGVDADKAGHLSKTSKDLDEALNNAF